MLPPGVSAVNLHSAPATAAAALPPDGSALFDGLLQHAARWGDVAWLQVHSRLPLLLKGVLHADDARQAARLGVAGLIVSDHGGRTLDTVPATADALPRIAQALALGAQAVLVGRPAVMALAAAGAQGVALALRLLRD